MSLRNTAALKKGEYLPVLQDERHVMVLLPKL